MISFASSLRVPLALALFWSVATALNLTKAVHIDDAAYLEIARHVLTDPLHPFSGTLNWAEHAEPIYHTNQPALLFFLYAAVMGLFGISELALHAVMALWCLAAIVFFYFLARRLCKGHELSLTAMFCLGPAFLPSQNLMTDVPTVALWLIFFWALLAPEGQRPGTRGFLVAATACAAACLTKYVSLVLLPLLCLAAVLYKSPRALRALVIPLVALLGWSLLNVFDYGGVHLLGRGGASLHAQVIPRRLAEWILCVGAVSPFTFMVVPYFWSERSGLVVLVVCALVAAAAFFTSRVYWQNSPLESALKAAFFSNGVFVLGLTGSWLVKNLRRKPTKLNSDGTPQNVLFAAWLLGSAGVVVVFSPGMAVRHVLTVVPVLLLICGGVACRRGPSGWVYAATALSVCSGVLFGISDWAYADVYRKEAGRLAERYSRKGQTLWHVGHWGWQWYACRAGIKQYDAKSSEPNPGDRMIVPRLVHKQSLHEHTGQRLRQIGHYAVPSTPWTFVRMMVDNPKGGYGFYACRIETLPWTFSTQPIEYFDVFELHGPPKSGP